MLMVRVPYDDALFQYLQTSSESNASGVATEKIVKLTKAAIDRAFGVDDLDYSDATYHLPELYTVQTLVEDVFKKSMYKEVTELVEYSLQYSENLMGISWPDDFMDCGYDALLELWIKAQLQLGESPTEVAKKYKQLKNLDPSECMFYHLPYSINSSAEHNLKQVAEAFSILK